MDQYLERYNLPRLNQDLKNLNRPNNTMEIETIIKNLPKSKSSGPDGFTNEFYQTSKDFMPILLKLFQKFEEEAILLNSFYEANIMMMSKPSKDNTKKKTIDKYLS